MAHDDKKKILIIDDEPDFIKVIRMRLEVNGFRVVSAENGKEGLKKSKSEKPDLILLDLMMPEMDGFEVLEHLKKDKKTFDIPVVILSAKSDDESKFKASQLYDEEYVVKGIESDELLRRIKDVLKRRNII